MRQSKIDKSQVISPPAVVVRIEGGEAAFEEKRFTETFCIGRHESCQVRLNHHDVSRNHTEVAFEAGRWWIRDLLSTNGTYVDGQKITRVPLSRKARVELGVDGPVLTLELESFAAADLTEAKPISPSQPEASLTQYVDHYFSGAAPENAGEHTMMMHQAFAHVQKKQKRLYFGIIAVVVALLLGVGGYALYREKKIGDQHRLAREIFYQMKELEIEISRLNREVALAGNSNIVAARRNRARFNELNRNYDYFVDELGLYKKKMKEDERIIFRMARKFGECEVDLPPDFVQEVRYYLDQWRSTNSLEEAIRRAERAGYTPRIAQRLIEQSLPVQFYYLALQESKFDVNICGPPTRYGFAKGMWQFIPATAQQYGLVTGPLVDLRVTDPHDDRHDFEKATAAAAKYLRFIYDTDAQASGLLVMASYNWGENKVLERIRTMPENPHERNFWRLLQNYRADIPQETYEYVFRIFSAAVIGENPRLFGFDFDNPLAHVAETFGHHPGN
jgi:pSer/pThr/pTyr-binding forkhead associated (FHA) protein